MIDLPKIFLNNNVKIPIIGNGPGGFGYSAKYISPDNQFIDLTKRAYNKFWKRKCQKNIYVKAVTHSLQIGFSLLDFSAAYGNEDLIGKAIHNCGIDRKNLFLTTRVSNKQQCKGNIREEFFRTLENFKTDYIDLYMFHWPVTDVYLDTWKQMEQLYNEGYCKAIGVANCNIHHLESIENMSEITPAVNQIEVHPLFTQKTLIEYCKSKNIVVEAYTPIARFDDRLMNLPLIKRIAQKYQKTVPQIVLRWHIENGVIPVVRSLNKKRQKENISIFDFKLTEEEIKQIDSININSRLRYDPDNCDFSIL